MNEIVPFRDAELALIRKTVAKDCLPPEFDMFIHIAKTIGLDPLRRQIYAFVFGKESADRQLTVVTGIDGYRTISERSGNYRPDDKPPRYVYDETLKSDANPLGIVSCEVSVFKYRHGAWHEAPALAFWDEFCPTTYRYEDLDLIDTGKKWKNSGKPITKKVPKAGAKPIIDPSKTGWSKMPRNQIAKCAEAQAHRKAFPNDFAGVYVEEELHKRMSEDLTASEVADLVEQEDRMARIGGPNQVIIDWLDGKPLAPVKADQLFGMAMDFIKENSASTIKVWDQHNAAALRMWWGMKKPEAIALRAEIEKAVESEKQ